MKLIRNRIAVALAAIVAAFAVLAPSLALGSGSAWGITYTSNAAAIVQPGVVKGNANFNGIVNSTNVVAQVRVLQNGAQIGSIVSQPLLYQNPYNFNLAAQANCSGGHTYVIQSRMYRTGSGVASAWDSGPGRFLYC